MPINEQHDYNGVFIVSSAANCRIDSTDISNAVNMPGKN